MQHQQTALPWYRQFWPWFIFLLPTSVVVAGLATVFIAIRHADDLVADDYYKEGLAINRYIAQDRKAQALQLTAYLRIDTDGHIVIAITGLEDVPDHLRLLWQHPTDQSRDFNTALLRDHNTAYSARLDIVPTGRWYLTLENMPTTVTAAASWRLKTEINLGDAPSTSAVASFAAAP